jgi:hypothetical protein
MAPPHLVVGETPVFLSDDTVRASFEFYQGLVFFHGKWRFYLYYTLAQGE